MLVQSTVQESVPLAGSRWSQTIPLRIRSWFLLLDWVQNPAPANLFDRDLRHPENVSPELQHYPSLRNDRRPKRAPPEARRPGVHHTWHPQTGFLPWPCERRQRCLYSWQLRNSLRCYGVISRQRCLGGAFCISRSGKTQVEHLSLSFSLSRTLLGSILSLAEDVIRLNEHYCKGWIERVCKEAGRGS